MTSLDPSHFPDFSHDEHDSRGQAVLHHPHPHLPAIPDLRFEQSYLKSIAPYINVRHTAQPPSSKPPSTSEEDVGEQLAVIIDWRGVAWITTRDQIISPLVQGAVWGFASQLIIPFLRHTFTRLFKSTKVPNTRRTVQKEGELTKRLREWSRSLTTSGLETNIVLRK